MKGILFYILFTVSSFVFSQTTKPLVKTDKSTVERRDFDAKKIESYKNDSDFIYTIEKKEPNWLVLVWDWIKRTVKRFLSYLFDDIEPAVGFLWWVLRILPYVIAAIVLYFIIKFFLKVNINSIVEGTPAKATTHLTEEEALIKENDLPKLIEKAILEEHYRLAIRYYYLLVLKTLSDKKQIDWKPEKTNEDYIQELTSLQIKTDFKKITYLYDYVWYGYFAINRTKFLQSEKQIQQFIETI